MEEKKKQEDDETVHEADTDTKSCQQDENACSEEKAETNDDNKAAEEPAGDTDNIKDDTQSEDREKDIPEKVVSINALRNMFGKEVTWAAVAALGGAAIVIWNIIRYIFLLCSSYEVHLMTKVPIYLLMMRRNVGFTDGYIFYGTIIVLCTIINPMRYLNEKVRIFLGGAGFVLLLIVTIIISSLKIPFISYHFNIDYITICKVVIEYKWIVSYILPILCLLMLNFHTFQISLMINPKTRKNERVVEYNTENNSNSILERIDNSLLTKKIIDLTLAIEKKTEKVNEQIVLTAFIAIWVSLIILFIVITQTEGLLDQDGRFVVADLGEQYIVQSAVYDHNEYRLTLDTSRYYVVDSNNESVEVIEFISEELRDVFDE